MHRMYANAALTSYCTTSESNTRGKATHQLLLERQHLSLLLRGQKLDLLRSEVHHLLQEDCTEGTPAPGRESQKRAGCRISGPKIIPAQSSRVGQA
jgi:hypothetical protein